MNSAPDGLAARYADDSSVLQQTIATYSWIRGARVPGRLSHQPILACRGHPITEFSVVRVFPLPKRSLLPQWRRYPWGSPGEHTWWSPGFYVVILSDITISLNFWSFLMLGQRTCNMSTLYMRTALCPTFMELSQGIIRAGFMCPCQSLLRAPSSINSPYPDWI